MKQISELHNAHANRNFKHAAYAEWKRLNPHFGRPDDDWVRTVTNAWRETLPGFFAPLRFFIWILAFSAKSIGMRFRR